MYSQHCFEDCISVNETMNVPIFISDMMKKSLHVVAHLKHQVLTYSLKFLFFFASVFGTEFYITLFLSLSGAGLMQHSRVVSSDV